MREGEAALDGLCGTAFAAFDGLWVKDAEQVMLALRRCHPFPSATSFGLALKGGSQNGRRFHFAFHGEHQALGHGFGPLLARLGGFGVSDEIGEAFAHGRTHSIEPFLQGAIRFQDPCELRRQIDDDFAEIGCELDECEVSGSYMSSGLHLFIHDEDVSLASGAGNERGFESEPVDLAEDAATLPHRPRFF